VITHDVYVMFISQGAGFWYWWYENAWWHTSDKWDWCVCVGWTYHLAWLTGAYQSCVCCFVQWTL